METLVKATSPRLAEAKQTINISLYNGLVSGGYLIGEICKAAPVADRLKLPFEGKLGMVRTYTELMSYHQLEPIGDITKNGI